MKIKQENDEIYLEYKDKKMSFREDFEDISKLLILSDDTVTGLDELEDNPLKDFIFKFLEYKSGITEEEIKEKITKETGYEFDN